MSALSSDNAKEGPSVHATCTPRTRSSRALQRGVTLVEMLNFLLISLVLVSVAMVAVARYLRHSKTAEAIGSLTTLGKSSAEFYENSDANQPVGASEAAHAMRQFPRSSRESVPAQVSAVKGSAYKSDPSEWQRSPWIDLRFVISQPQRYSYSYESEGVGASASATAKASGDLDGDGELSSFSLMIKAGPDARAVVGNNVIPINPEE
jgi:Tfp pilus assembly protein PilE